MTRSVECVLVGVDSRRHGIGAAFGDAVETMKALVGARFPIGPSTAMVVHTSSDATIRNVRESIAAASVRCKRNGLFILMFSGHGGFDRARHSWRLFDGELSDHEIAKALGAFDQDTEIFIVSDCCYGAGMLRPGARSAGGTPAELRHTAPRPADIVLAAPTDWLLVRGSTENTFVRTLCKAVPEAETYSTLLTTMTRLTQPNGQSNWIIDAQPKHALERAPLAR